jgi:poly(hydroxyalkanoate) depolymerase family esterase
MAINKLAKLWGRGVKRLLKSQQNRNKKLLNTLARKPAAKAGSRKLSSARTAVPPLSRSLPDARTPGKWLSFIHASPDANDGGRMRYWLYLPEKIVASPLPLVVMLHGCAQSATEFAQGTRMNLLAEKKGFAVLYPQQSARADANRCWRWYDKATQEGIHEVKTVVAVIEAVIQKYGLDRRRIYVAGLSAGAAMAHIIALNYPDLIAAVGLHSGTVFGVTRSRIDSYSVMQHGAANAIKAAIRHAKSKVQPFPVMPAILVHGRHDRIVRPVNQAQLSQQFQELNNLSGPGNEALVVKSGGKSTTSKVSNAYSTDEYFLNGKPVLKICEILNLEHAWSGGDCTIRFNECKGPDASRMMWSFFAKQRRPKVPGAMNNK